MHTGAVNPGLTWRVGKVCPPQRGQNGDERQQWGLVNMSFLLPEQAWKERCQNVLEGRGRWLALAQGSLSPRKKGGIGPVTAITDVGGAFSQSSSTKTSQGPWAGAGLGAGDR